MLGYHSSNSSTASQILETLKHKKISVLKVLDYDQSFLEEAKRLQPELKIVGRLYDPIQPLGNSLGEAWQNGLVFAERILNQSINKLNNPPIRYWESYNERLPSYAFPIEHQKYAEFQMAFSERMSQNGFIPVNLNFATGNGDAELISTYYLTLLKLYPHVGVHEYDFPTLDRLHQIGLNKSDEPENWFFGCEEKGDAGCWLGLRYRRMFYPILEKVPNLKVFITECGLTQGVLGGQDVGWLHAVDTTNKGYSLPIPEDFYINTLNWYQDRLIEDSFVIGAALFVTGSANDWKSFESTTIVEKLKNTVDIPELPPGGYMFPTIYGLHDSGGEHLLDGSGYVAITEEIGHDRNNLSGVDYRSIANSGQTVIVRLNNGYGSTGTIPLPKNYVDFAIRVSNFIKASKGCNIWIIGNEPNLQVEWPDGEKIYPNDYAQCFRECLNRIPEGHTLLVAGPGPWNNQIGNYEGNERGDWVKYLQDQITNIQLGFNSGFGISLHAYTHGHDPNLIYDNAMMNPPFSDRHYNFKVIEDFMHGLEEIGFVNKPIYLTEMNANDPNWTGGNNGWCEKAYEYIDEWNRLNPVQQILCGVIFRWQDDPLGWSISTKPKVKEDFIEAVQWEFRPYGEQEGGAMFDVKALEQTFYENYMEGKPPILWEYPKPSPSFIMSYEQPIATEGYVYTIIGSHLLNAQENNGQIIMGGCVLDENGNRVKGMGMGVGYPGWSGMITNEKPPDEMMFHHTVGCNTGMNYMIPSLYNGVGINSEYAGKVDNWTTNWNIDNVGDHHCHQSIYCVWLRKEIKETEPPIEPPPIDLTVGSINILRNGVVVAVIPSNPTDRPQLSEWTLRYYDSDGKPTGAEWTSFTV